MTDIPIILGASGRVNTDPNTLRTNLIAAVSATNPGYTANLPGSLIEDIVSTDVGALVVSDQAVTETINSLTPFGANQFILAELGNIYGVTPGSTVNTSVYVVFSGTVGFVIQQGFTVSDGTYQYVVQDASIIATGGSSAPVYCVATTAGAWAVPTGSVTSLVTSVPSSVTLSVTNPTVGTPSAAGETEEQYRARVFQAGLASAQGMPTLLKTSLTNVTGVQDRLVSVQQQSPGWKVLVGGGDPYQVANAIFQSLFDVSSLVGSTTTARNITVSINDYPDTYSVIFVNPPSQNVGITLTWNTTSTNVVSPTAVAQAANPALVSYINSIVVGQPINLFELQSVFQAAVADIVTPQQLTRMVFAVTINSTPVSPTSGTGIIAGDSESYFTTNTAAISIVQG